LQLHVDAPIDNRTMDPVTRIEEHCQISSREPIDCCIVLQASVYSSR